MVKLQKKKLMLNTVVGFRPSKESLYSKMSMVSLWCLLFCYASNGLYGQGSQDISKAYSAFDYQIGEQNMTLYNGPVFIEKFYNSPNTHPYFKDKEFRSGKVIYQGLPYFGQKIKYNTFLDELIITTKYNASGLTVQLVKEHVNEFHIHGHRFIHLNLPALGEDHPGYMEVLHEASGSYLLKKHRKKKNDIRGEELVITEFTTDTDYYVFYKDAIHKVNSKGQWKAAFPDKRKRINKDYQDLKRTSGKHKDAFYKLLFIQLIN